MPIRLTTLSENTAGQGKVLAEWGLSVLIETGEKTILLDSGATLSLAHNVEALGIDLSKLDTIVLSHGHYDHTGGLQSLLGQIGREIEIIAHPDIFAPKYNRRKGKPEKYIGIPFQKEELESLGAKFILTREPYRITEDILTTGEIPMVTDFEQIGSSFYIKNGDEWQPDPLLDDLALIIKTTQGLVVQLGCAHRGMINTLYRAREITGVQKVLMVTGGSHLIDAPDEQIWQTISALNEMGVTKLGLSHCTGMQATLLLAQTYDKNFIFNNTGNIINLA